MARVTVEDCMDCVGGNRFALVLLATKRSRQLMAGAVPRVAHTKNKPAVLALREIADQIEVILPDDLWPLPTYREMLFIK